MTRTPATCHPERRNEGGGLCSLCYYRTHRPKPKNTPEAREARRLYANAWARANREKKKAYLKVYWEKRGGPEAKARYDRNANYRRAYGLTCEAVEAIISAQRNRCRICAAALGARPHLDHDHRTKEIRGVICAHCNWMIGHAKDNPQVLTNAAHYLMAR